MAQFNIDIHSGSIRISQVMYGICPGMSQATLFSRAFAVPVRIREGLVPSEMAQFNTDVDSGTIRISHYQIVFAHIVPCSEYILRLFPQVDTMSIQ